MDPSGKRISFVMTAFQVVRDTEFEAIFKAECQKHGINLFVLSLCLVKLNGAVERAHQTHTGEVYAGDILLLLVICCNRGFFGWLIPSQQSGC